VAFEVEAELAGLEVCNCSICVRTAYIHWYVEPARFRLLKGESELSTYRFGTGRAAHHFCQRCGVSPFRRARSDPDKIDVNVRCVEGVALESLDVARFDGQNWETALSARGTAR
jgi:hypothetical protein